ncbi:putative TIM-barrel fold metal-dependent hydrolase [Microbacterium ginsengiterrae]|uniref:Putative TIM-barrel fold metal-dependent hydrolase n=1 Tax=Microbacterium ginsengiterrae TaxID=546115 RepID=A0A7W9CC34_9MICO|nr:putative TIM-barrel fold metal-dependent hydrolase [Microbacterium ginsengiterrae]
MRFVMRFDAHIHLFEHGFSGERESGAELADYLRLRARHSVGRAIVVGYEGDEQFAGNNDYILSLAAEHEWIVPFWFIDPSHVTVAEVQDAADRGARGFSLYLGADATIAGRVPTAVWAALASRRAPLSVNATPDALDSLGHVAEALGDAPLLISHLGLPGRVDTDVPREVRTAALARLAAHPHVLVKLSALYAIDPAYPHLTAMDDVRAAVDAFGPDRIIWGSDFSPGLDVVDEDELFALPPWVEALFPAPHRERLLRTTLLRAIEED